MGKLLKEFKRDMINRVRNTRIQKSARSNLYSHMPENSYFLRLAAELSRFKQCLLPGTPCMQRAIHQTQHAVFEGLNRQQWDGQIVIREMGELSNVSVRE